MATSNSPLINLSGMASGLDTNSIVTQLVALRKQPAVALDDKISLANTRKSGLQSASNLLTSLKGAADALGKSDLWTSSQTVQVSDSNVLTAARTALTAPGGYSINVVGLARAEQQRSGASFTSVASDDILHLQVGSGDVKDISVSAGDTVDNIATKINATSNTGVYASVINGALYLSGKTTGASNTISLTSDDSTADDLGMTVSSSAADARYTVNGGPVKTSSTNTIKDAVAGVAATFKQTGSSTITIGDVQSSADTIADKLQAFVDAFNSTGTGIQGQLTTQPIPKAASTAEKLVGSLFNNNSLQATFGNMRTWYSHQSPDGSGGMLSKLGIKTPSAGTGSLGGPPKLTFDRQAFLDAYAADPEATKTLITNYTNDASTEGLSQWAARQVNSLNGTSGVITNAVNGQDSQVKLYKDRQERIVQRAGVYETHLRAQYTHLETSLSALQSQTSQLTSQITGMTNSGL